MVLFAAAYIERVTGYSFLLVLDWPLANSFVQHNFCTGVFVRARGDAVFLEGLRSERRE